MNKVQVIEIQVGTEVKGNLVGGFHTVAKIVTGASHLKNTAAQYSFLNADGVEFFIGRGSAKATTR